eukprot:CAMPEP_0197529844 /NCGR_PEP_ID=MMETSP1318-20131121/29857_1 /TAXON_ID=552666 /ORGANISM="Partenskyella glossopodia, Strain RCC365" /LENGTH=132 /DNA_ID=CAMNT_0043085455 /DNA_START=318 /DNA_END=716 /DNA_ORIENTATION=-
MTKEKLNQLAWWSDFFWLFEVLPLVPVFADKLNQQEQPDHTTNDLTAGFLLNSFDTLVAAHDLGLQPSVGAPARHLLGTITSLIGVRSVVKAAREVVIEKQKEKRQAAAPPSPGANTSCESAELVEDTKTQT